MQLLNEIVVAVDFSPNSKNALLQAMRLAGEHDASIRVVHVVESETLGILAKALGAKTEQMEANSVQRARERLRAFLEDAGALDKVKPVVRNGDVFEEIMTEVKSWSAELLVLGSRGMTGTSKGASALATKCIRAAKTSVLVVRRAHTSPYTKVCAILDFSKKSEEVLKNALWIARSDGANLHVCHIHIPPWDASNYLTPAVVLPFEEDRDAYRAELLDRLREEVKPFEQEACGLHIDYDLVEGPLRVVAIDEEIDKAGVDLVVLSTRGRTGIGSFLFRTVAEHIVRTSPCSVLTIRA
jgi:nucleotide-binding universal stress UspA family protein